MTPQFQTPDISNDLVPKMYKQPMTPLLQNHKMMSDPVLQSHKMIGDPVVMDFKMISDPVVMDHNTISGPNTQICSPTTRRYVHQQYVDNVYQHHVDMTTNNMQIYLGAVGGHIYVLLVDISVCCWWTYVCAVSGKFCVVAFWWIDVSACCIGHQHQYMAYNNQI